MFNKKKPINKLKPFKTTGAKLSDNRCHSAPAKPKKNATKKK